MRLKTKPLAVFFSAFCLFLKTEASRSCPCENKELNYQGYRDEETCFTLIREDGSVKRQKTENLELLLGMYCASNFKAGELHYFNAAEEPSADTWLSANSSVIILNRTNFQEANAFICSHRPYEDCDAYEEKVCRFIREKKACFLQNVQHVEQKPEMPYGMRCPNYTESALLGPCQCTTCKFSHWTTWTQFVDKNGREVFTRYRPRSGEQWPCLVDHKPCCAKVVVPRLGIGGNYPISEIMKRVSCAEGGRPIPELSQSKRCECEDQYNGIFCEIYTGGCITHICANGGTCTDYGSYYRCSCKRGFAGENCEIKLTSDQIMAAERSPYRGAAVTFGWILGVAIILCAILLVMVKLIRPKESALLQMMLRGEDADWSSESSDEESVLLNNRETRDGEQARKVDS